MRLCTAQVLVALLLLAAAGADGLELPASGAEATARLARPSSVGFDLLLLVRSYSPTFCKKLWAEEHEECSADPVSAFTLHGLWPEYESGGYPHDCHLIAGAQGAAEREREGLEMRCEWPSFSKSDAWFHGHEWDKHGTCAAPLLGNRSSYFSTALRLHNRYDVNAALASAGLGPADGTRYDTERVVGVLGEAFGAAPLLSCYEGAVDEVWSCLDLDLKPIECPPRVGPKSACKGDVVLPEGGSVDAQCERFFPPWPTRQASGWL